MPVFPLVTDGAGSRVAKNMVHQVVLQDLYRKISEMTDRWRFAYYRLCTNLMSQQVDNEINPRAIVLPIL